MPTWPRRAAAERAPAAPAVREIDQLNGGGGDEARLLSGTRYADENADAVAKEAGTRASSRSRPTTARSNSKGEARSRARRLGGRGSRGARRGRGRRPQGLYRRRLGGAPAADAAASDRCAAAEGEEAGGQAGGGADHRPGADRARQRAGAARVAPAGASATRCARRGRTTSRRWCCESTRRAATPSRRRRSGARSTHRAAGKPVVASMGNVAASGGYMMAVAAEKTGAADDDPGWRARRPARSLRLPPAAARQVERSPSASSRSVWRPLSSAQRARLNETIDAMYADFKSKVADGRALGAPRRAPPGARVDGPGRAARPRRCARRYRRGRRTACAAAGLSAAVEVRPFPPPPTSPKS